ncbi:GNS1/SUR4 family protein [Heterostelium album PN500]|uniref:GNS1/SUR4 family protein n=1 Tax=Heterostelium pallidum (strain ATCC 26659 / Pp 5 / PN500) TaxID=670386 RepID=D3B9B6_HETP5|nr:GNS1/SUR4 family protein [Heterostelium album PN500]EFA81828.1 GNS1/SUR4 family protein [Heterostelium album PN500]|eukprot:XP_020433945.1 GNS1/SUR4 family protein [Heterostelium album PN500]
MTELLSFKSWEHLFKHRLADSDWSELWNLDFKFTPGKTPFSQFSVIPIVIAIYLVTIFTIKFLMRNRKPFELKSVSVIHNVILCAWSFLMCAGVVYECYKRIMVMFSLVFFLQNCHIKKSGSGY